ncbi:glycosyltransferase family 39 protein [Millisia brevis]|uniref:glycosyltransferase family 39 protein n=1 Tax=Millisia brevis TaxID=264148 RepID=UPI00082EC851|nr:glycosyltransferase family 39 protein [Millisia brevis]
MAALIGACRGGVPSLWYDEAATLAVAQRDPAGILRTLGASDAVHGLYYLGMHLWISVFGASEWSVRLPSAIACGVAAAGVVVAGRLLADTPTGIYAGLVCAVLPRMTWAAVEARSYAATAAVAVWTVVVWWCAVRARREGRPSRWWWVGYAALLTFGGVLFVYSLLLGIALVAALLMLPEYRRALPGCLAASAAAAVALTPFLVIMLRQAGQVAWIPAPDARMVRMIGEYQYFLGAPLAAIAAAALVVVVLVRDRRAVRAPAPVIALAWMLVPTIVLVAVSLLLRPIYLDRYPTFTAPAAALLIGWAIAEVARTLRLRAVAAGLLATLVLLSVPGYAAAREPGAKPSAMDISEVANYLADRVAPGDCALYARVPWLPTSLRVVTEARPHTLGGLVDPDPPLSAAAHGWLWDQGASADVGVHNLSGCSTVWLLTDAQRDAPETVEHTSGEVWHLPVHHLADDDLARAVEAAGFHPTDSEQFRRTLVVRYARS